MYSKTDQSRSQKWDRISLIRENSGKCEQENAEIFTAAWKGKEYFKQSWNVKFSVEGWSMKHQTKRLTFLPNP